VSQAGPLAVNEPISAGSATVRLNSGADVSQNATGTITAGSLAVVAGGNIDLCVVAPLTPNTVGTFAASTTAGFVHFLDNTNLIIGAISNDACANGASGVTATAEIDLRTTAGSITLNNAVSSPGQIVRLNASSGVSQTAGGTISASSLAVLAGGNIDLCVVTPLSPNTVSTF